MSPINRAGSVYEISSLYSFRYENFDEKLGWVGYRDLGSRDENFPIWTLQPGQPRRNFLDKIASLSERHSGQNDIIFGLYVLL